MVGMIWLGTGWGAGRPGEEAIEVARLIERGLRESRAVDQEALVVVSGRKVRGVVH